MAKLKFDPEEFHAIRERLNSPEGVSVEINHFKYSENKKSVHNWLYRNVSKKYATQSGTGWDGYNRTSFFQLIGRDWLLFDSYEARDEDCEDFQWETTIRFADKDKAMHFSLVWEYLFQKSSSETQ